MHTFGLRGSGRVVGSHVAHAFAAAVAAADRVFFPRVVHLDTAQAAGAGFIMAAVVLRTVQINHTKTPPGLVCPQAGRLCTKKQRCAKRNAVWLGRPDSNRRMEESKSSALPLGDGPVKEKTVRTGLHGLWWGA